MSSAKATVPMLGQPDPLALSMHYVWSLAWKILGDPFLMFSLFSVEKKPKVWGVCVDGLVSDRNIFINTD